MKRLKTLKTARRNFLSQASPKRHSGELIDLLGGNSGNYNVFPDDNIKTT